MLPSIVQHFEAMGMKCMEKRAFFEWAFERKSGVIRGVTAIFPPAVTGEDKNAIIEQMWKATTANDQVATRFYVEQLLDEQAAYSPGTVTVHAQWIQ